MPIVALMTIFVPLFFLGAINLAIFFQEPALGNRVLSIATLMIAFVQLIPIIREQIPPNPTVTIIESIVYMEALTTFFCALQSLLEKNKPEDGYNFNWSQSFLFYASCILTGLSLLIPLFMFIIYKFCIHPQHNLAVQVDDVSIHTFSDWRYNHRANQLYRKYVLEDHYLYIEGTV